MKRHFILGLLLLALAFSAAGSDRATAAKELADARAKWAASRIDNYEITLRDETCYCLYGPYYGPIRNVVTAGKLRASYYEGQRRDGYWYGRKVGIATNLRATIEDLFTRVERLVATAPEGSFRVAYDPTYGFPVLVEFDDPAMEDEQWRVVTGGFKRHRSKHQAGA